MNIRDIKEEIKYLKSRTVERFDSIRTPLNFIKKIKNIESVSGCVETVEDVIDIAIKYETEDYDHLLDSLIETPIPKENIEHRYFLVSIRDNDFYVSLSTLGNIFVRVFGYEFTDSGFNFEKFKTKLPDLICTIFSICQDEHSDYVKKHLKICYTPKEINEFIKTYGMGCYDDYENPLFKDDPEFAESLHCDCNAEALIIKLAYDKTNNEYEYIEEQSEWLVI